MLAAVSRVSKSPAARLVLLYLVPAVFAVALVAGGGLIGWTLRGGSAAVVHRSIPDPLNTPAEAYSWRDHPEADFPVPPYARFLSGVTIVLDPGHVGQSEKNRPANWKRGPSGLREAAINLSVAQFLKGFLDAAGAKVVLTRDVDRSLDLSDNVDLAQRAEVANRLRADLFLSIHHNGVDNPKPNYTSLWYHKSPDRSAASLCAARHLLTGLNDALRLEEHLECAVLSDELQYKENGFAVLRQAEVPAVLCEASFFTNPAEEARLRDKVYNRREAYGLFLGLARWAQAGLPRVRIVEPADRRVRAGQTVVVAIDDGLSARGGWGHEKVRVLEDSIVARLDDTRVQFTADLQKDLIKVTMPAALKSGPSRLCVDFENIFGQRVLHPWIDVEGTGDSPAPREPATRPTQRRPGRRGPR